MWTSPPRRDWARPRASPRLEAARASAAAKPVFSGHMRVQRDIDVAVESLRNRTVLLRSLRRLAEGALVDAGHVALYVERHRRDSGAAVADLERTGRRHVQAPGRVSSLVEAVGERHRVASGVGRRDQLLRACLAV